MVKENLYKERSLIWDILSGEIVPELYVTPEETLLMTSVDDVEDDDSENCHYQKEDLLVDRTFDKSRTTVSDIRESSSNKVETTIKDLHECQSALIESNNNFDKSSVGRHHSLSPLDLKLVDFPEKIVDPDNKSLPYRTDVRDFGVENSVKQKLVLLQTQCSGFQQDCTTTVSMDNFRKLMLDLSANRTLLEPDDQDFHTPPNSLSLVSSPVKELEELYSTPRSSQDSENDVSDQRIMNPTTNEDHAGILSISDNYTAVTEIKRGKIRCVYCKTPHKNYQVDGYSENRSRY